MTTFAIASRFRDLARDAETQAHIVKEESCMSGLVSYLTHDDVHVVRVAAEAVALLAAGRNNRKRLYRQPRLVAVLTNLTGSDDDVVKQHALSGLKCLNKYATKHQQRLAERVTGGEGRARENNDDENAGDATLNVLPSDTSGSVELSKKKKQQHHKTKKRKRKPRTFALQVTPSMDDELMVTRIEKYVIRVRGIISLTLDQRRGQILVTTKKKKKEIVPALIAAVGTAGATAVLLGQIGKVQRNLPSSQAAVEKNKSKDDCGGAGGNEDDDAGYLDGNDYFGGDSEGVLSRFGSKSLQARLAEQRRLAQERAQQQSTAASVAAAAGNAAMSVASWFGY